MTIWPISQAPNRFPIIGYVSNRPRRINMHGYMGFSAYCSPEEMMNDSFLTFQLPKRRTRCSNHCYTGARGPHSDLEGYSCVSFYLQSIVIGLSSSLFSYDILGLDMHTR